MFKKYLKRTAFIKNSNLCDNITSLLSTINLTSCCIYGTEFAPEQGFRTPNAPRAPQHKRVSTASVGVHGMVCVHCCGVHFRWLNAEHEFRVWVTILGHHHHFTHTSYIWFSSFMIYFYFIYLCFLLSSSSVHIHFNRLDGFRHLQKVFQEMEKSSRFGAELRVNKWRTDVFIFVCVNLKEVRHTEAGSNSSLLYAVYEYVNNHICNRAK